MKISRASCLRSLEGISLPCPLLLTWRLSIQSLTFWQKPVSFHALTMPFAETISWHPVIRASDIWGHTESPFIMDSSWWSKEGHVTVLQLLQPMKIILDSSNWMLRLKIKDQLIPSKHEPNFDQNTAADVFWEAKLMHMDTWWPRAEWLSESIEVSEGFCHLKIIEKSSRIPTLLEAMY